MEVVSIMGGLCILFSAFLPSAEQGGGKSCQIFSTATIVNADLY